MARNAGALLALGAMFVLGGCGSDSNGRGASSKSTAAPTTQAPATSAPSSATTTSTPTSKTTTPQNKAQPDAGSGGGTPAGTPQQDKPPPGSPAERFNKYCSAHPGACGD